MRPTPNFLRSLLQFSAAAIPAFSATVSGQITIQFDYSYDGGFFTGHDDRKAVLQAAASALTGRLTDSLAAIVPGAVAGTTWEAQFRAPSTGNLVTASDLMVAASTMVIYVGGRDLTSVGSNTLGLGGPGGAINIGANTAGEFNTWFDTIAYRGQAGASMTPATDFAAWGGAITFTTAAGVNWYYNGGPATSSDIGAGNYDFYSVALHEIGHVLGYGGASASSWSSQISGGQFSGVNSAAVYGGPVPVDGGGAHWSGSANPSFIPGTTTLQSPSMTPSLSAGQRKEFTALDFAGLSDIGWQVTPVPEPVESVVAVGLGLAAFAVARRARRVQTGSEETVA